MKMTKLISAGLTTMLVACAPVIPSDPQPDPEKRFEITSPVEVYLSTVDQTHLFTKVEDAPVFPKDKAPTSGFDVRINPNIKLSNHSRFRRIVYRCICLPDQPSAQQ
jgi:hypothetical protein